MTKFVVNAYRHDPYKNFKFRVIFNGKVIGGITDLTVRKDAPVRKGKIKMPGMRKFSNITLKRGTFKATKFFHWMAAIPGTKKFPNDIVIEQFDKKNNKVASYHLSKAWLSKVEGPALKAAGNEVAVEQIGLSHKGLKFTKY
jgi:phage tail-like protein